MSAVLAATAMTITGAVSARAATIPLYSFETGDTPNAVDGFARNPPTVGTVTQSTVGVTAGSNSGLFTITSTGFNSAFTSKLNPVFTNAANAPTNVTLSITVPTGFTYTGGYALIGVTLFGTVPDPDSGTAPSQFQVIGSSERQIPFTTPGVTTNVDIPLIGYDPLGIAPSVTYAQALAEGFVPTSFAFFFDKNAAITVAIDNVAATAPTPEPASLGLLGVAAAVGLRRRRA